MESIQHRGACFVYRDYKKTSSVTSMLFNLGWESLQDWRKIERLTMLQKIRQGQVAIPTGSFLQLASSRRSSSLLNHRVTSNQLAEVIFSTCNHISIHYKWLELSPGTNYQHQRHTTRAYNSSKSAVTSYICPSTASSNSGVRGNKRKINRNLRKKWGKWNSCPPGTVRLATALSSNQQE